MKRLKITLAKQNINKTLEFNGKDETDYGYLNNAYLAIKNAESEIIEIYFGNKNYLINTSDVLCVENDV
jgi:hypothetical protein